MTKPKVKSGSQILAMMERLTKDYVKCHKKKSSAHPDTVFISGMLIGMNWIMGNGVNKQIMEFLNGIDYKPIATKLPEPSDEVKNMVKTIKAKKDEAKSKG